MGFGEEFGPCPLGGRNAKGLYVFIPRDLQEQVSLIKGERFVYTKKAWKLYILKQQ